MTLPAVLILIWAWACNVKPACRRGPAVCGERVAQEANGSDQALALPSGKLKQSEGYHAYMDRMTREQQEAINELTAKLNELAVFWHDFYVTDKNTGVEGRKFTGHTWRGLLIFGRESA